ncbi:MAG TPA: Fic family protein [Miltoncostaeaceae bacterium]|nr:Fic family protein [Miltoncostaeaceae bacterium]
MSTTEYRWSHAERVWPGDPGAPGGRANRRGFRYRAYVPGPVARWRPVLPADLADDAVRAEVACRDLGRHGARLETLLWPLLRSEALASSRIEGLVLSHHRLAHAGLTATADPTAAGVRANVAAVRAAVELAAGGAPITPATLDLLHGALLGEAAPAIAGRVRTAQNWIGGRHPNPRGAAFVPPPPEEVPRLMGDLCRFIARDDLPAVVQAAIAHVQFETIHPYADGNGRLGRILIPVVLRRRGVTAPPGGGLGAVPPVSLVLAADGDGYVRALQAFRAGDTEPWLRLCAWAVWRAAQAAEELAARVEALTGQWRVTAGGPRPHSAAARLIAALPAEPVVDLAAVQRLTGSSHEAARLAIARLADAGVLRQVGGGRRGRIWEAVGLFALLDDLEAGLGPGRAGRAPVRPPTGPPAPRTAG